MAMYSSYFMQASRLSRYVRTLWNYIFMGDRIWQERTNFGCQNWSGGTVFGGGPIFSLQAKGLSMVTINLDGFSLANRRRFAKFAKLSPRQTKGSIRFAITYSLIFFDLANYTIGHLFSRATKFAKRAKVFCPIYV